MVKLRVALTISLLALVVLGCGRTKSDPIKEAPGFELEAVSGGMVSLSDFRGKTALIAFWTMSCPHCVEEMPDLQSLHDESDSKHVVITVNVGDSPQKVKNFLDTRGLTLETLLDRSGEVAGAYGVTGVPCLFAVDPNGLLKAKRLGAASRAEMIDMLSLASE